MIGITGTDGKVSLLSGAGAGAASAQTKLVVRAKKILDGL